jgi:queuine tRNA-ribosyltransferase
VSADRRGDGRGDDPLACEVVVTREGARAIRDQRTGELMHPVVGPRVEAERLYASPARLRARLAEEDPRPLVLADVGLGAGSNALAAFEASAARAGGRQLSIVSFDHSLAALALATRDEHATAFGFQGEALLAARALLADGLYAGTHATWRYVGGALPESLGALEDASVDVVFWDPFSPRANPKLWTVGAFVAIARACRGGATLHTYGGATSTRAALLLAGFAVGLGPVLGDHGKKRATEAAIDARDLSAPLDARWLERLARSSAPWPDDAPHDALARVQASPQFRA